MAQFTYDLNRLCEGFDFLVDRQWGEKRIARIKEAVDEQKKEVYFRLQLAPLNEYIALGRKCRPALANLLKLVEEKRKVANARTPKRDAYYQRMKDITYMDRQLTSLALQIELRKARKTSFTKEEKQEILKPYRAQWKRRRVVKASNTALYPDSKKAYDEANREILAELKEQLNRLK